MKAVGILFLVVAVLVGVIPAFTSCAAEGKALKTADGRVVPMKCFWTSRAAIGTAIPLGIVGLALTFSKRKETMRSLGIVGGALSLVALALPTALIGVCAMDSACKFVMKPSLMLLGGIGAALGAVVTGLSFRGAEELADAVGVGEAKTA